MSKKMECGHPGECARTSSELIEGIDPYYPELKSIVVGCRWCAEVAAARAEEREACAKVADGYAEMGMKLDYDSGWERSASLIASSIRSRSPKP